MPTGLGDGVIGVCTAYYLARQGQPVTLVEKDDLCPPFLSLMMTC